MGVNQLIHVDELQWTEGKRNEEWLGVLGKRGRSCDWTQRNGGGGESRTRYDSSYLLRILTTRVHIRVHHSKIHNLKPKENLLSDVQIILCHWDTILINLVGGYHTDLLAYTNSQFTRSAHLNILSIQDIVPSWHQSNSEQNSGETDFSNLAYLL